MAFFQVSEIGPGDYIRAGGIDLVPLVQEFSHGFGVRFSIQDFAVQKIPFLRGPETAGFFGGFQR